MIRVNLLPGGKKRAGRGGPKLSLPIPNIKGLPTDRWVLGSSAVVIVLILAAGYLYFAQSGRTEEVSLAVEEAAADSAVYADLIEQAEQLRARRDSIAERVEIIQEIDRNRYVWPHIMDEVARALPDYTWLSSLIQTSAGDGQPDLRIEGFAGNNFALTTFMETLEASPYIRAVALINTQLTVQAAGGVSRSVNQFTLEASYEEPPLEMRQTVPLFGAGGPGPVEPTVGAGTDPAGATATPLSDSAPGAAGAGDGNR